VTSSPEITAIEERSTKVPLTTLNTPVGLEPGGRKKLIAVEEPGVIPVTVYESVPVRSTEPVGSAIGAWAVTVAAEIVVFSGEFNDSEPEFEPTDANRRVCENTTEIFSSEVRESMLPVFE